MENDTKTKISIEFNQNLSCSIKCLAEKKNASVKPTSGFFSSKMLMFAKISFISYVYDVLEAVCFSHKITREIYEKYSVEKILPYQVLTSTDSIYLFFFFFVCKPECEVPDKKFRNCLFEITTKNEVSSRFNTLAEFWERFSVRDKALHKKFGYYEVEHINDSRLATVTANPKEYFKYFVSENVNKKHMGLKKRFEGHGIPTLCKNNNFVREI